MTTKFISTGTGYFKIAGTNGVVLPRGSNGQRPTASAVLGMTRYNTDSKALEVWDGFSWVSTAGAAAGITASAATDIAISVTLMLG